MQVIIETEENTMIAKIQGEIDHHNAPSIRKDIDVALDKYHPKELILDFDEVTFMDSSGIGLVMGRYKTVKLRGGKVAVINTSAQIRKVMTLAGLARLVTID